MTWPHSIRAAAIGALLALPTAAAAATSGDGQALALHGAGAGPPCSVCHGAQGQGNAAIGAPALAGEGVAYLHEQLANFAAGRRRNPIMQPIAAGLSPAQRESVAAYYARLPPAAPPTAPPEAPADPRGVRLAERGDWSRNLPACAQCHGPDGIGVPPSFPHLAGLAAPYTAAQLDAFRSGARPPGPLGLMAVVARKLSAADSAAVAAYFAVAGGTAATGAGR